MTKQRCLACGVEKDASVKEVYPYPENGFIDGLISPFMSIDCQDLRNCPVKDWRVVTVCHQCFHQLDVDMWISEDCWRSLNPVTPFEQLPKLKAEQ